MILQMLITDSLISIRAFHILFDFLFFIFLIIMIFAFIVYIRSIFLTFLNTVIELLFDFQHSLAVLHRKLDNKQFVLENLRIVNNVFNKVFSNFMAIELNECISH